MYSTGGVCVRDDSGGCERLRGQMNTVTPSTGLKHAQFLVKLHSSYMGHDWAHHGWLLFLKMKEKSRQEGFFFVLFVHIFTLVCVSRYFTGGWYHSYGRKRGSSLIYCVWLFMAPQLPWSYL